MLCKITNYVKGIIAFLCSLVILSLCNLIRIEIGRGLGRHLTRGQRLCI